MNTSVARAGRVLDASERVGEILFGLIMALSFTGTIEIYTVGDEVRPILVAALGCNLAWGFIDGVMYVVQRLVDRGREALLARQFDAAKADGERRAVLAQQIPSEVIQLLRGEDLEKLHAVLTTGDAVEPVRIRWSDLRGALGVCLLVVLATFPVVLPYLLFGDLAIAKRVSNGVSILLIFLAGYTLGRYSGASPIRLGFGMVALGVVMVGVTLALGG